MNIKYKDGKIWKKVYSAKPGEYYVRKYSDGEKMVKQIEKMEFEKPEELIFHVQK